METGVFEGRAAYVDALRSVLLKACEERSREIFCVDASFAEWPWSEAPVLAALTQWAGRPRRLQLLALQYDEVQRRHPRFVRWRRDFDHCVESRAYEPEAASGQDALVGALFVEGGGDGSRHALCLRLFDTRQWRFALSIDAGDVIRTREWFDALAQRSSPSFAPTSLGL